VEQPGRGWRTELEQSSARQAPGFGKELFDKKDRFACSVLEKHGEAVPLPVNEEVVEVPA
jgi:hypothetical protein